MVFSSLNFLLIFLPIVLLLHSVLPFKYKNIVLLAASIIFYAWGEPVYVILMILSIGFNYMSGLVLGDLEDPHLRKRQLIFAVAVNLLLLGFFKYAGFLVSMINAIPNFIAVVSIFVDRELVGIIFLQEQVNFT